jgi:predicted membrane GTPase involved in stress response
MIGFRSVLLAETAGSGVMNSTFTGYEDYKG